MGKKFLLVLTIFFCFTQYTYAEVKKKEKLLKVVVLTRHGIRAPRSSYESLKDWTEKEWPKWPIPEENLTPRGSIYVSNLWSEMHKELGLGAFFPKNTCPDPKLIYVRSNTMERTQNTAVALLNGLIPGCRFSYYMIDAMSLDPFFLPVEMGICSINTEQVSKEFEVRGGLKKIEEELKSSIKAFAHLLGPCPDNTCKKYDLPHACTILDIPGSISFTKEQPRGSFKGSIKFVYDASEALLLCACQWPNGTFADINPSHEALKKILPIQNSIFNIRHRLPTIAQAEGSALLSLIKDALVSTDRDPKVNNAKLVVFVGHDLNITSVAGLLSLHWDIGGGYEKDALPLGGLLVFSLWETPKGNVVKAHFICQSLDTITQSSVFPQKIIKRQLSLASIIQNKKKGRTVECKEQDFVEWSNKVINKKCIPRKFLPLKEQRCF